MPNQCTRLAARYRTWGWSFKEGWREEERLGHEAMMGEQGRMMGEQGPVHFMAEWSC